MNGWIDVVYKISNKCCEDRLRRMRGWGNEGVRETHLRLQLITLTHIDTVTLSLKLIY